MGLFSFLKKNKTQEQPEQIIETAKRIKFEQLHEIDDSHLTKLATNIINGKPLIINFETLDIDEANKTIAFLSGVVYAIEGEIETIKEDIILFGNSEVYLDGSVKELLKNL